MPFMGAILHATAVAVLAFFVLYAASKSEGLVSAIGKILAVWLFVLAVLALVGGAMFHMGASGPFAGYMMEHHPGWMMHNPPAAPSDQNAKPAPKQPKT